MAKILRCEQLTSTTDEPRHPRHSASNPLAFAVIACSGLLLFGCGDVADPAIDDLASVEEAYSDGECRAASADVTLQAPGSAFSHVSTTPLLGYNNPQAFKSFIWDVEKPTGFGSFSSTVYTNVRLQPSVAGLIVFNPTWYDTAAECTGIRLRRHLYQDGELVHSFNDNGYWSDRVGCTLPASYGPFITFPQDTFGPGETMRVCGTARIANGNTIPMTMWMTNEPPVPGVFWNNPRIKNGSFQYPVLGDTTSGTAYCLERGFSTMLGAGSTKGSPTLAYIQWSSFLHQWQVPAHPSGAIPQDVWTTLVCE